MRPATPQRAAGARMPRVLFRHLIAWTPVDGRPTDMAKLAEFAGRGVLALMSDSTNADQPGITPSEAVLYDAFHQIMRQAPGRLIIATFASLVSRMQTVVDVAKEQGRKIAKGGPHYGDAG